MKDEINFMEQVIAFERVVDLLRHVDFSMPNWKIVNFSDASKYDADAYFQMNVKKYKTRNRPEWDFIANSGKPVLVCESTLFRKNSYTIHNPDHFYYRLGWNHFLRQGNFNNVNAPPDRWNYIQKLQNIKIMPWKQKQGSVLLCLQKPGDSTLNSLYEQYGTYEDWIGYAIETIKKYTDASIVIRPHLKSTKLKIRQFVEPGVSISQTWNQRTLEEGGIGLEHDFANSCAVTGYNSNALVESTCAGIPTFPLSDESVVWDVSNRIENLSNPNLSIDRTQWLYDAAYMIWTVREINNGTAWQHLRGVYFK